MLTRWCALPVFLALLISAAPAAHAPYVFMAGNGSTVSVFDAHGLSETSSIPYPGLPLSAVFSPDGSKAFVTTGKIYVTDASTHKITGALPSPGAEILRISADGQRLYAANSDNSIWVYDLASGAVLTKIAFQVHDALYYSTADLQVSADGSLIVQLTVENRCGDEGCPPRDPPALLDEIDGSTFQVTHQVQPSNPYSTAISPDGSVIYVAAGANILEYAASTGAPLNPIAASANLLLVDGAAGRLYAGGGSTVTAITISNNQVAGQASTPYPVAALAVTPDSATLFAGGCGRTSNSAAYPCTAVEIATANMQAGATLPLAGFPGSLAVSPNGNELWAANRTPAQVTVAGSAVNKTVGAAEVAFSPYSLAVTPDGGKVYVSSAISGDITVVDGQTFARRASLNVGNGFNIVGENAVSPDGARAYMILDAIQVIDTATDQIVGKISDIPQSVAVSNNSQVLFTLDLTPATSVGAYSAATFQKLYSGRVGNVIASRLLISPANNELFVIADTSIQFVNPKPIQVVKTIGQGCLDAVLAPSGSLLYCLAPAPVSGAILNVLVYDTSSGDLTNTFSTNFFAPSGSVAITPDGASLFVSMPTPGAAVPAVLEKMNTATGAIAYADTILYGQIAIQ